MKITPNIRFIYSILTCIFLLSTSSFAQQGRFVGLYPISMPSENSTSELKEEYQKNMSAIYSGVTVMNNVNPPNSNGGDMEVFTKQEYIDELIAMVDYGTELATILETKESSKADYWKTQKTDLEAVHKAISSAKYGNAFSAIQKTGVNTDDATEAFFYIWMDYLNAKDDNAAWLDPRNKKASYKYRTLIDHVSNNYDRPFGAQAELGALSSDAAQALSNCLEFPEQLLWKGEGTIKLDEEDELRRLAGCVAYFDWRLHDPINGQRSAHINRTAVRHISEALFWVVATMSSDGDTWYKAPEHGINLQQLYIDAKKYSWRVDGIKAVRSE